MDSYSPLQQPGHLDDGNASEHDNNEPSSFNASQTWSYEENDCYSNDPFYLLQTKYDSQVLSSPDESTLTSACPIEQPKIELEEARFIANAPPSPAESTDDHETAVATQNPPVIEVLGEPVVQYYFDAMTSQLIGVPLIVYQQNFDVTTQQPLAVRFAEAPPVVDQQIFEDIDEVPHAVAQYVAVEAEEATDNEVYPQPKLTYTCINALAIKNSAYGRLRVTEIYEFMLQHFPYFKQAPRGWKNMVRHNLSHNKSFEMTPGGDKKRSGFWSIKPARAAKVDAILVSETTGDLGQEIRRAMSDPEILDWLVPGETNRDAERQYVGVGEAHYLSAYPPAKRRRTDLYFPTMNAAAEE